MSRSEKRPSREAELIYRTGVVFLDLPPEQQEQLTALVQAFHVEAEQVLVS